MTKTIAMLAALTIALAMLLTSAVVAEENAAERFCDTWVDDGVAVEIWQGDDSTFHCHVVLGNGGDESTVVEYGSCHYDPDADHLICQQGTRAVETFDEAAGELKSDVQATDLTAEFAFKDGEDALVWNDSESLGATHTLIREEAADAQDYAGAQAFAGQWVCDRASVEIAAQDDGSYDVVITWADSAFEQTEWHYACAYYGDEKAMKTYEPGTKATVTYGEDGAATDTKVKYQDGEAVFTLDETGHLHWADTRENAGDNMVFERA